MSKNDGGPSFPSSEMVGLNGYGAEIHEHNKGMSLRDYFAARAPMPIPDWFKHDAVKPRPTLPDVPLNFSAQQRDELATMERNIVNITGNCGQEVESFWCRLCAAKSDIEAWRNEQRELKFFAWRYYYADMMIAEATK